MVLADSGIAVVIGMVRGIAVVIGMVRVRVVRARSALPVHLCTTHVMSCTTHACTSMHMRSAACEGVFTVSATQCVLMLSYAACK